MPFCNEGTALPEEASDLCPLVAPVSPAARTSRTYEKKKIHFLVFKECLAIGTNYACKLKWPYSADEKDNLDA